MGECALYRAATTMEMIMKYVYRMSKMSGGSDKYGKCECCGKDVESTFLLVELAPYQRGDGSIGLTHHDCHDKFGHKSCLAMLTENRMQ